MARVGCPTWLQWRLEVVAPTHQCGTTMLPPEPQTPVGGAPGFRRSSIQDIFFRFFPLDIASTSYPSCASSYLNLQLAAEEGESRKQQRRGSPSWGRHPAPRTLSHTVYDESSGSACYRGLCCATHLGPTLRHIFHVNTKYTSQCTAVAGLVAWNGLH